MVIAKDCKGDKRKMNFLKKILKYLIGTCEDCKHCKECAENGFMCGYVGGIHPNFFELKEIKK